jgi:hypothetical protein
VRSTDELVEQAVTGHPRHDTENESGRHLELPRVLEAVEKVQLVDHGDTEKERHQPDDDTEDGIEYLISSRDVEFVALVATGLGSWFGLPLGDA